MFKTFMKTKLLLLVLMCAALAAACGRSDELADINVFDITLPSLSGEDVSLAQFKGQVIMLNYWATWCPPCRQEIPDFIDLVNDFGPKGLVIVGVSLDEDNMSMVGDFSREANINYPVLYAGDLAGHLDKKMGGMRGIPTTFLVDRQGKVIKKVVGVAPRELWVKEIKKLL
jgi:peroxiredoxin